MNLSPSIRRWPWRLLNLTEDLQGHWTRSSNIYTSIYGDPCLLTWHSETEEVVFVSQEFSVCFLQVILRDLCIDTCVVHCRSSRGPAFSLSRSFSSCNCHLFVRFHTSCTFSVIVHTHFFLFKRGCLEQTSSILSTVWRENLSRLASSRLKPPTWPPMT
jgi:hypothetical protein